MRQSLRKMLSEFKQHWKRYVLQSLLATGVVCLMLALLKMQHMVITASLGSTAFVVFAMPNSLAARPRNVVGGQLVGVLSGALCSFIPHSGVPASVLVPAGAVGLSIFLMVVTDTEHPPASGTALGVVTGGVSLNATVAVIVGAALLSVSHQLGRRVLKDIT